MQPIIQSLSEVYLIALCLVCGPAGQSRLRVDIVGSRGLIDTFVVQRSDDVFTVYDEMGSQRVLFATLERKPGKLGAFVCTGPRGEKETIDLPAAIQDFDAADLQQQDKRVLKGNNGAQVTVARSGSVTYVTAAGTARVYVVHADRPANSSGQTGNSRR